MKGKLLFIAGIATGYVLGARAGRKRYEQIKQAADRFWEKPSVQQGVDQAKEFAMARVGTVSDVVLEGAKKLVHVATEPKSKQSKQTKATQSAKPKPSSKSSNSTAKPAEQPAAKAGSADATSKTTDSDN